MEKIKRVLADVMAIIASLALLIVGILLMVYADRGLSLLRLLLIIFLSIMMVANIFSAIFKRKGIKEMVIYTIAHMLIIIFLIRYKEAYVSFVGIVTGLYTLLTATIYFIDFCIAREDHLSGILSKLILSIILYIASLFLILIPDIGTDLIFIVSGIYLIIAALIHLAEAILDILGRRINVALSLPVVLGALIPPRVYMSIKSDHDLQKRIVTESHDDAPLEVFIYLRDDGIFESLGHTDIAYKGVIYSYGLHDPKARKVFGSAGDGVLIKSKKGPFIENCLKSGHTIIIDFKLYPSEEEMKLIEKRIADLMKDTYPFICESHAQELLGEPMDAGDYISDVYRDTHCELYKFKKGRFKTYFVFTTNCVGLADYIIRNKEVDLLNMNGIITPGNYLNFLYRLYQRPDSIVKGLEILKKTI